MSLLYEKELNSDVKPRISNKLYIFDPIMFPIIILDFPFLAAVIDVAISGKDVPKAIIVKPIKESEILSMVEIDIAESTVISAPKSVIPMAPPATGNPQRKGFLNEIFEKKSFSKTISSLLFESEFLKLLNI